jgi:hypothetical protein
MPAVLPLLLLAAVPATPIFCDPGSQSPGPGGSGRECNLTRAALPTPGSKIAGSDYSMITIGAGAADALDGNIELELPATREHTVTLVEFGIDIPTPDGGRDGGVLALRARVAPLADPQLEWAWYDGTPSLSVTPDGPSPQTIDTIAGPVSVASTVDIHVTPEPDWCHVHLVVSGANGQLEADKTIGAEGASCVPYSLRAGVIGNDLEVGMGAAYHFYSDWLIGD